MYLAALAVIGSQGSIEEVFRSYKPIKTFFWPPIILYLLPLNKPQPSLTYCADMKQYPQTISVSTISEMFILYFFIDRSILNTTHSKLWYLIDRLSNFLVQKHIEIKSMKTLIVMLRVLYPPSSGDFGDVMLWKYRCTRKSNQIHFKIRYRRHPKIPAQSFRISKTYISKLFDLLINVRKWGGLFHHNPSG